MPYASGGSRISGKGVHIYSGVCVCGGGFDLLILSPFLKYPIKMK